MSFDAQKLYSLLPAVHRVRDAEQGFPLRQLIEVIAGQVAVVEENLEQLYDNQFVETAAPWALPYIGDLLGIRGLSGSGNLTLAPRAEVGHTIAYRRRKGTAAMLELLARDVTGWPARAVEFFERLAATQHFNHVRPRHRAFTSLRNADALEFFGTPFEHATRTVEVRRIQSGRGKWNIPNVGVFLWRLRACSLTRSPLAPAHLSDRHFRFHPLGLDTPLFNLPVTEDEVTHLAEPLNVPIPITRRMLRGDPLAPGSKHFHPSTDFYGAGRSLELAGRAATDVLVCDLSDVHQTPEDLTSPIVAWAHEGLSQTEKKILLDPMLGRVVFPADRDDDHPPLATFHYAFSANLGGGEYDRARSFSATDAKVVQVANTDPTKLQTVAAGLAALGTAGGVVEITDSSRYVETLPALDATSCPVEIRAADQRRPTLVLKNTLKLTGDADGTVTLNGLLLSGHAIEVNGKLGRLRLRHCTLVPLLVVQPDGSASLDGTPALTINAPDTTVEIEDCIVRPLRVSDDLTVSLRNTIVDAGDETNVALAGLDGASVAGSWRVEQCTIIGKVAARVLELASNSIFLAGLAPGDDPAVWPAPLFVQRRQEGCVRFCWLPLGARVPRRHECLPADSGPDVRPHFTSLRFGHAAYCQLGRDCPEAIRHGADDESEMGIFHDLFQPQREAQLRARLIEYLRFGLEAGVFYAT